MKTAKKDDKGEYPGLWKSQKGIYRASRASEKGIGRLVASPELIGERATGGLKGMAAGGAGGAGLGAIAGKLSKKVKGGRTGAVLGGIGGAIVGGPLGAARAESKYLKKRGITQRALGLGGARFSREAKKKYLTKYKD